MILLLSKWVVSVGLQISTKRDSRPREVLLPYACWAVAASDSYYSVVTTPMRLILLSISDHCLFPLIHQSIEVRFRLNTKLPVVGVKSWKPLRLLPRQFWKIM